MITGTDLEKSKHISDKEVRQDIADTEAEIKELKRRLPDYTTFGDTLSMLNEIEERKVFIQKLKDLLKLRGGKNENSKS